MTPASNHARRRQAPAGASSLEQVQIEGARPAGSLGRASRSRRSSSRCRTRPTRASERKCARESRASRLSAFPFRVLFIYKLLVLLIRKWAPGGPNFFACGAPKRELRELREPKIRPEPRDSVSARTVLDRPLLDRYSTVTRPLRPLHDRWSPVRRDCAIMFYVLGAFLPSIPSRARNADPRIKTAPGVPRVTQLICDSFLHPQGV